MQSLTKVAAAVRAAQHVNDCWSGANSPFHCWTDWSLNDVTEQQAADDVVLHDTQVPEMFL